MKMKKIYKKAKLKGTLHKKNITKRQISTSSKDELYNLVSEMENSINAIAWGCDALVHTLYDGQQERIDGAVWVADKIRSESVGLQLKYKKLFQSAVSKPILE